MTLLALIPARGGSKGIKRKNIKLFCGKPLLEWTVQAALSSPSVDKVVVSTDDLEIADLAANLGAEVPFLRPSELAMDSSPGIAPVLHSLEVLPSITDIILLQPTSPFRTVDDIEGIIEFREKYHRDAAVSVCSSIKHPTWMFYMKADYTLNFSVLNQFFLLAKTYHLLTLLMVLYI